MKNRWLIGFLLALLLLSWFLLACYNGFVFVDGTRIPGIAIYSDKNREHVIIPVIVSLCELGYEKISEENGIISLQRDNQILTIDLNALSLTCPQSPINCIEPMPGNTYYFCERKGNDILLDSETFSATLGCIGCNYIIEYANPKTRVVKYTHFESQNIDIRQLLLEYSTMPTEEKASEERASIITEARLLVNGTDITGETGVCIDHGMQNAEIPLVATLRALGYEIDIEYDESRNCYEAVYDGEAMYTTAKQDFNIPLQIGESGCIRKFEYNDFIVDTNCIRTQMYWLWQADITVDYDTSTIYVDSCDPWA